MTPRDCLLAAALLTTSLGAQAWPRYTLFDLGALDPQATVATRINDAGQVLGLRGQNGAFLYTPGAGLADLAVLTGGAAGDSVYGLGLNNAGEVVGSTGSSGFVYRPGTGVETLPVGLGAKRINDVGQYVGEGYDGNAGFGYRYTPGVGIEPLPLYSVVADINNAGQVAGVADYDDTGGTNVAARFGPGGVQLLGDMGGGYSGSNAINNRGDVVGWGGTATASLHAFLYTDALGMVDLDPFGHASVAHAVNDHGVVGGAFWEHDGDPWRAFVTDGTSGLVDLNTLLDPAVAADWTIESVEDINNAGQIVGVGLYQGVSRAFILSTVAAPVPEPALAWLVLAGLGLVGWRKARAA